MIGLWIATALAEEGCEKVGMSDVIAIPAPAILVLGERHGSQPDIGRARKVIKYLREEAPVTVALEAVPETHQTVLQNYADGQLSIEALPQELEWEKHWGFPFSAYKGVFSGALYGDRLIAAGPVGSTPPRSATFPVPTGYLSVLASAMSGHEVPPEWQKTFVRSVTWQDWEIADNALSSWNGEGYLVVLASRVRVEGGKGVGWQLQQRAQVPVRSVVLAWAESPCFAGDWVWTPTIGG